MIEYGELSETGNTSGTSVMLEQFRLYEDLVMEPRHSLPFKIYSWSDNDGSFADEDSYFWCGKLGK